MSRNFRRIRYGTARSAWIAVMALASGFLNSGPAMADVISDNLSAYTGINAQGYLSPLKEAVGQSLNSGLYNSAHIPPSGTYFRLELKGMLVSYEDEDRSFQATSEDFFPGNQTVDAPTIVGDTDGAVITDPGTGATFHLPGGLDIDRLALAVPQLTVGSVYGFEATVRYFGADIGDTDIGNIYLLGGGLRYAISPLIKAPFDIAATVFYQKFKLGDDFMDSDALSYGLQVGRSMPMLDVYGGVGMDRYKLAVTYDSDAAPGGRAEIELPAENDFHLALGATVHLGFLHLNGEYNHAARSSFAFGVGLGMR